jgi:hypothetical protein
MDDSDLLVLTLNQLGCLPEPVDPNQKINSIAEIQDNDFRIIIHRIINKIIQIKGMDVSFPENPSIDMTRKYQEAQKIAEFIKSLGYRGDLGMNSILHPSQRDKQRIIEFTLEIITSNDVGESENIQGITEKNMSKIKISKILNEWYKDIWIIPELNNNVYSNKDNKFDEYILKIDNSKMKSLNKVNKENKIIDGFNDMGKNTSMQVDAANNLLIIQEQDNELLKYSAGGEQKHNYLIDKLKYKNKLKGNEKSINQELLDSIESRNKAINFLYHNYKENNFINNVKIIRKKNKEIFGNIIPFITQSTKTNNEENKTEENNNNTTEEEKSNLYKSKLDNIINTFEEEKKKKNEEINELNNEVLNITNQIEKLKQNHEDNIIKKNSMLEQIENLKQQNNDLLKEIQEQMTAFEQMKKLQKNEMVENEVIQEVEKLEKKYEEMINNWEEYSKEAKGRIQELKTAIDTKKKEYSYKYEQIGVLKKEIEEITIKISMKEELAKFLNEEYQKIPIRVNRNIFINRIADLTKKIENERRNISQYINDLKDADKKIDRLNTIIKRVHNELEETLFNDAKKNKKINEVYKAFIQLGGGYDEIQKNILETSNKKYKLKELTNTVDEYKAKLKSYDIEQLKEQVEFLKKTNNQK